MLSSGMEQRWEMARREARMSTVTTRWKGNGGMVVEAEGREGE